MYYSALQCITVHYSALQLHRCAISSIEMILCVDAILFIGTMIFISIILSVGIMLNIDTMINTMV